MFARFMTTWEKQILTRAIEIQKENLGNHAFLEIIKASSSFSA